MLKRVLKSGTLLVSGTAGGQLIVVIFSPVLTRLYVPDEFGVFGAYAAVLYMLLSCVSLRYEVAIPLAETDEDADYLAALALSLTAIFSLLLFPVLWCVGFFYSPKYFWIFQYFLPLGAAAAGVYNVFMYMRLRRGDQKAIAKTRVTQLMVGTVIQIGCGFLRIGVAGLVVGQIIGLSFGLSRLTGFSFEKYLKLISRRDKLMEQARQRSGFAYYDAPAALMAMANNHMAILLTAVFFSPAFAGGYALAQRVIITPLGIVSSAISSSLISVGRDLKKSDRDDFFEKQEYLLLLITPVAVVCAILSMHFVGMIFGSKWEVSGAIAAWIVLFVGQKFVYDASFSMYAIQGRMQEGLFSQLIVFIVRFAALIISAKFISPVASIGVFSLVSSLVYLTLSRRMLGSSENTSYCSFILSAADVVFPYIVVGVFLMQDTVTWGPPTALLLYFGWCFSRIGYSFFMSTKKRRKEAQV